MHLRHEPDEYRVSGVAVRRFNPHPGRAKIQHPPVVMVHGGNHTGSAFNVYADELAEHGYEVHVLDWYNHGDSFDTTGHTFVTRGIAEVARGEIASVTRLLPEDPILIGHSMGGAASLIYAAEHYVSRLVLIAPTPIMRVNADVIPVPVDWEQPFPVPPFEQAKAMFWQGLSEEEARPLYEQLTEESPRAVHEATRYTLYVDLSAVDAPVFGLAGELDNLYPPDTTSELTGLLGGTYASVGGGHSDMLLNVDGARRIAEWLTTPQ